MRDTLKRLFSAILVIALVLTIAPPSSWIQASAASGEDPTLITLTEDDGTEVPITTDKDYTEPGKSYSYTVEGNILTLENFNGRKITANGTLNIRLKGTNTINMEQANSGETTYGIYTDTANLRIDADEGGVLNINGNLNDPNKSIRFWAIKAGGVSVYGGTVNINIEYVHGDSGGDIGASYGRVSVFGKSVLNVDIKNTGSWRSHLNGFYQGLYVYEEAGKSEININLNGNEEDYIKAVSSLELSNFKGTLNLSATGGLAKNCTAVGTLVQLKLAEGGKAEFKGTVLESVSQTAKFNSHTVSTLPADNNFIEKLHKDYKSGYSTAYVLCDTDGNPLFHSVFEYKAEAPELKWTGGTHFDLPAGKLGTNLCDSFSDMGIYVYDYVLTGGVRGGSGNYTFTLKSGALPKGMTLYSNGRISEREKYSELCDAGTVRIEVKDNVRNETVEFDLNYGEIIEPDRFITVGGETLEMRTSGSGTGWSYDGTTATLTLNGYNGPVITAEKELNIHLKGTNTINMEQANSGETTYGIYTDTANLRIDADEGGVLNINGNLNDPNKSIRFWAIKAGGVSVYGGTVNINIEYVHGDSGGDIGASYGRVSVFGKSVLNVDIKNTGSWRSHLNGFYQGLYVYEEAGKSEININLNGNEEDYIKAVSSLELSNFKGTLNLSATGGLAKNCTAVGTLVQLKLAEGGKAEFKGTVLESVSQTAKFNSHTVSTLPADNNFIEKLHKDYKSGYSTAYVLCDTDGNPLFHSVFEYKAEAPELKWTGGTHFDLPAGKLGTNLCDSFSDMGIYVYDYVLTGGVRGGSGNYTFTLKSGALPKGMTLYSNGRISEREKYSELCDAGTVRIEVKDNVRNETVEFDLNYGEISPKNPVQQINLDKTEITLGNGKTADITASVIPTDADVKKITATSANTDVARVKNVGEPSADGKTVVTLAGVSAGVTTVTLKSYKGLVTAKITVYVKESTPNISIAYFSNKLYGFISGKTYKITGEGIDEEFVATGTDKLIPDDWYGKTLSIVATKGTGTDSDAQVLVIPAIPEAPTGLTTTPASYDANDGVITGTVNGLQYSSDKERWTSFSGMEATGLSDGTYFVRLAATDSAFAGKEATVTVEKRIADPSLSGLSDTTNSYKEGTTYTVSAYHSDSSAKVYYTMTTDGTAPAAPTDASDLFPSDGITLSSVAGTVTKISVIAYVDGKIPSKVVTHTYIVKPIIHPTEIILDKTALELLPGESYTLSVTVKPDDVDDDRYAFESSDYSIVAVDSNGKITVAEDAEAGKKVIITVKTLDGEITATCEVTVLEKLKTGWVQVGADYYYYDSDGKLVTGWTEIDGSHYYLDPEKDGKMITGWQQIGGNWYYFNQWGKMVTGWIQISGKWYYFNQWGKMVTGWVQISGKWYYFNSSGAMLTGWQSIGGKWYYFNSSGAMLTGWQQLSGKWYYFNSSGAMLTGWQQIGGKWYYFNSSGAMLTGWQSIGGKWYYFNSSGAMLTGWQSIGGKWYYFNNSGAMLTGTQRINGKTYTFNSSGVWIA